MIVFLLPLMNAECFDFFTYSFHFCFREFGSVIYLIGWNFNLITGDCIRHIVDDNLKMKKCSQPIRVAGISEKSFLVWIDWIQMKPHWCYFLPLFKNVRQTSILQFKLNWRKKSQGSKEDSFLLRKHRSFSLKHNFTAMDILYVIFFLFLPKYSLNNIISFICLVCTGVQNRTMNVDENIYIPITKAEFAILKSAFNVRCFLLYCLFYHFFKISAIMNECWYLTGIYNTWMKIWFLVFVFFDDIYWKIVIDLTFLNYDFVYI